MAITGWGNFRPLPALRPCRLTPPIRRYAAGMVCAASRQPEKATARQIRPGRPARRRWNRGLG